MNELIFSLAEVLPGNYGIEVFNEPVALSGGYWNDLYQLDSSIGKLVVRVSHPATLEEGLHYEHQMLALFAREITQIPLPVYTVNGTTSWHYKDRWVTLFPYFPGKHLDRQDANQRVAAAAMLARLHNVGLACPEHAPRPGLPALEDFDWFNSPYGSWDALTGMLNQPPELWPGKPSGDPEQSRAAVQAIYSRVRQVHDAHDEFYQLISDLRSSQRKLQFAPVQGDYYRGNLLTLDGKITAVLDWDECHPEWLVYELARATWEFCQDDPSHSLDIGHAHKFLEAYKRSGGPVPSRDFDLLVPLMRCVRIIEVMFALGEANQGRSWDPAYTYHNLIGLETLENTSLY